jgi:hypothetical protein
MPSVANDNNSLSPDEEPQKQLFREIKEIGWCDREILGPHHHEALRIWWRGKAAPELIAMPTGQTPPDPANDN